MLPSCDGSLNPQHADALLSEAQHTLMRSAVTFIKPLNISVCSIRIIRGFISAGEWAVFGEVSMPFRGHVLKQQDGEGVPQWVKRNYVSCQMT